MARVILRARKADSIKMRPYIAVLALAGVMNAAPRMRKAVRVEPGQQAQITINIPSPAAGDWIDVVTSTADVLVHIVSPDGREIEDARRPASIPNSRALKIASARLKKDTTSIASL
jgi:hypothetical protein